MYDTLIVDNTFGCNMSLIQGCTTSYLSHRLLSTLIKELWQKHIILDVLSKQNNHDSGCVIRMYVCKCFCSFVIEIFTVKA